MMVVAPGGRQEDAVTDRDETDAPADMTADTSLAARIDAASRLHGGEWRAWMMRRLPRVAAAGAAEEEPAAT
jgi:hypothetical protein